MSTPSAMLVSLTVGKVDAGVAVLLTEDKRLVALTLLIFPPLPGLPYTFTYGQHLT